MKNYFCIFLLCIGFASHAQDSTMDFSRDFLSFGTGANIVHTTGTSGNSGVDPWLSVSYNHVLSSSNKSCIGLQFGGGYAGYDFVYNYGADAVAPTDNMQEAEINAAAFINYRIIKNKIGWFNELELVGDILIVDLDAGGSVTSFNGNHAVMNLFYQTGIWFRTSSRIHVMPVAGFSLLHLAKYNSNEFFGWSPDDFTSARVGLTLIYSFSKE